MELANLANRNDARGSSQFGQSVCLPSPQVCGNGAAFIGSLGGH